MIKIFDGHNDTLLRLYRQRNTNPSFFDRTNDGHIDYPRAQEGNLAGGFFAIFSPSDVDMAAGGARDAAIPAHDPVRALQDTIGMSALMYRIQAQSQGKVRVVRTSKDLQDCLNTNTFAMIFHIEGAEAIDRDLNTLELLFQAGLRSLGLVWSRPNIFAEGVPFSFPNHPDVGGGLTDAGKDLVVACNRLGIMIDLSHLNARGFWDVAELSNAPLVATHSNAYALCKSARNLTDEQLEAVRDSDGMVGLNFATIFLREDGARDANTPIDTMVRHVDYLIDKLGEDNVGFGSDYDGALIPEGIKDVTGGPKLIEALRAHGYDEALLRKLGHENWLRVLTKTWHDA